MKLGVILFFIGVLVLCVGLLICSVISVCIKIIQR